MARRPAPISYAASLIVEQPGVQTMAPAQVVAIQTRHNDASEKPEARLFAQSELETGGEGRGRRPLEDKSDPSVLYLHPAGKKALRLYAVEKGCKVHDLLLEALEEWANARGLSGPWRVPSAGPARRRR
jgi:hypothetical protein